MVAMTCLTSEMLKVENANFKGEDTQCMTPYPEFAAFPSYIAKNDECVRTSYMSYTKFYISSTTGKYEKTNSSGELPIYNNSNTRG